MMDCPVGGGEERVLEEELIESRSKLEGISLGTLDMIGGRFWVETPLFLVDSAPNILRRRSLSDESSCLS